MSYHSQYLFQAVPLYLQCQGNLRMTISRIHFSPGRFEALYRLQTSLDATEKLLFAYVSKILNEREEDERCTPFGRDDFPSEPKISDLGSSGTNHGDMLRAVEYLKHISSRVANSNDSSDDDSVSASSSSSRHRGLCLRNPQEATIRGRSFYTNKSRGAESQLLFRLVVIFQLLLVRIDDAHYVITGHRMEEESIIPSARSKGPHSSHKNDKTSCMTMRKSMLPSLGFYLGAAGLIVGFLGQKQMGGQRIELFRPSGNKRKLIGTTAKLGSSLLGLVLLKGFINVCWMSDKIIRSNNELLEWNHQWELIHCIPSDSMNNNGCYYPFPLSTIGPKVEPYFTSERMEMSSIDEKSKTLIEYALKHGRKSYFWRSTGEIRFLVIKRFMDIYYASVGAGVHCTKDNPNKFFLPLVAGAAASYYSITGAPTPSIVNDASSHDLIQHAWGMVSLPVLKDLMLQASRLVKGASVADRITLCGVPCFILSKDPAPELAAALKRQANVRPGDSSTNLSQLSTIAEETEIHLDVDETNTVSRRKSFAGSKGQYRQRDVILHLTGGGFFAHTIASDLPYLLDWSSSTGSVVICPEYSLLPENQFPTQLDQIAMIYSALASGNTGADLGFDASSIIVTGESAGGNLAAALCVKLALQNIKAKSDVDDSARDYPQQPCTIVTANHFDNGDYDDHIETTSNRMPDAIMLSCPALNLTTELSHSRVIGTEDPVLPNALISAISEAYLPIEISPKNPLVSPFYASDRILRKFPPTLLFASSKDPLLDDSVTFNERLRVLGVDSELMAVHNVPHAYLGLGTAGFPEAVQVQKYAMDWLSSKFS